MTVEQMAEALVEVRRVGDEPYAEYQLFVAGMPLIGTASERVEEIRAEQWRAALATALRPLLLPALADVPQGAAWLKTLGELAPSTDNTFAANVMRHVLAYIDHLHAVLVLMQTDSGAFAAGRKVGAADMKTRALEEIRSVASPETADYIEPNLSLPE